MRLDWIFSIWYLKNGLLNTLSYPGIQILCTKCFEKHHKSKCGSRKAQVKDYVINFAIRNPDYPSNIYGRWVELIEAAAPLTSADAVPINNPVLESSPDPNQTNASRVKTSILNCVFWLKPSHGSKLNCTVVYFVTINCWKRKDLTHSHYLPSRVAGQPFKIPLVYNLIHWNNF